MKYLLCNWAVMQNVISLTASVYSKNFKILLRASSAKYPDLVMSVSKKEF